MIGRREAIIRVGLGTAGLVVGGSASATSRLLMETEIAEVAESIRRVPRASSFEAASKLIKSGVDWKTMLAAIFLCGVRGIRPRPHGILHCVMMVESSFQLGEASRTSEAWLPVLWNLNDFKSSQDENRRDWAQWELPPPRPLRVTEAEKARREFVAAMDGWDVDGADRAIVTLSRTTPHSELFEILWPIVCRCYAFIGHKMIYAAQVERVVRRIGMPHAEPALRSLVMASLVSRDTAAFERSRDLARAFPGTWKQGREDSQQSLVLLREFRRLGSRAAQELVLRAFRDGLGPQTVWDGLRLFATELFMKRAGRSAATGRLALLPVHAVTVTNALAHAYRATRAEQTKRLMVLQAAGWLPALRDDFIDLVRLSMHGPGVEALGSKADGSSNTGPLVDGASADEICAHLETVPNAAPRYLARLRDGLFRKGQEPHQHKYAAAVAEESAAVHPRWAARILAPAAEYLANPTEAETDIYRKSIEAVRSAGFG